MAATDTTDNGFFVYPPPAGGGGGGGTVTSVGLALPVEFVVSGSPVVGAGTLTGVWANENANYVFAGPTGGAPAVPAFRLLVAADIPTLTSVFDWGKALAVHYNRIGWN